ncbi:histidine phosphatase family protein [Pseudenhygromyxa sp. WMMC2535]|uniref:histidine phosphatase family protein n=1 Tax=Pseudenhygromyxa sp. WMMC2535 TaxID=2712867 RepID=UPI001554ACBC|nr:histidine phosphatase family protein [Pseudenhygromyxa sp. WMMC2535]NVB43387.1 histidine phosphatase family protein [Pseudenhygromyxa sp. WMMC2535]
MSAPRRIVAALVRHGDYHQPEGVPSAMLPHPLTERGREQAWALGAALHGEAIGHGLHLDPVLDASALLRATETANLAAQTLRSMESDQDFEVEEFLDLAERSTGSAANLDVEAIAAAVDADPRLDPLPPRWKSHPRFRLPMPGAESMMQAGARVAAHIEARAHQLALHATRDTLKVFVSHGGALRHAAVCMGALDLDEVPGLSMHHCGFVLLELFHSSPEARAAGAPGRWQKIGGQWKVRPAAQARD